VTYLVHALVAALCIGGSYALNLHQRPTFARLHAPEHYREAKGNLSLRLGSETREVELMSMHVDLQDVPRLDRIYKLRELHIRAAAPLEQQPQLELYIDLSKLNLDPADGARDPRSLAQQELPVQRSGRFGAQRSLLALHGDKPKPVISGSVLFTELAQLEAGDKPLYRTAGRIELQVAAERGIEMVTGRLEGQIEWRAP